MSATALLAVSHGTSSPRGQAAVAALAGAVAEHLPDVTVRLAHVDVQQPDVATGLASFGPEQPVVLVPLLLSAGYHVHVDLHEAIAERQGTFASGALGPDTRLVEVLAERLKEIGLLAQPRAVSWWKRLRTRWVPGNGSAARRTDPSDGDDAVVLAVAGSSDERANDDCRAMAALLSERLARPVSIGFLAAAEPRLDAAVRQAAADASRVFVASYLLAPGYFQDLAQTIVSATPCTNITQPLLTEAPAHPLLVELVVDRYTSVVASEPAPNRSFLSAV